MAFIAIIVRVTQHIDPDPHEKIYDIFNFY